MWSVDEYSSTAEAWFNTIHYSMVWEILQVLPNVEVYLDFPGLNKTIYGKHLTIPGMWRIFNKN